METIIQDLRYCFRMLLKSPGFTGIAVLCLALAIGANSTVFTIVNGFLFLPLPISQPDRVVVVNRGRGEAPPCSYPDYMDYRDRTDVFSGLAAFFPTTMSFGSGATSQVVLGEVVSGNYFSVLGVDALRGRTFLYEEDRVPGAHPVAVVSYGLWKRSFGLDPDLVGKTISLNGNTFTIVGVAPEGFVGVSTPVHADVWIPTMMQSPVDWL